ncbi:MAG: M23 family metallopeptidase [Desulfovibrionaceae bacterium]|nr:M23 family metallopeptidase [Desulfovibrionaceae bacterium]
MFRGRDISEPVVHPDNERYTVETDADGHQIFHSVVARGDTAGVILNDWLPAADVMSLINAAEPVFSLATIHEGRPFSVECRAQDGDFLRFVYEIDTLRRLVITRRDSAFAAAVERIEYETQLVKVQGVITSSLFEAVAEAGEGPALAVNLADVFSCEINFINEIREGDSFEVLVEKLYREGEFKGYGRMLAARFENQGRNYEAYLFADAAGRPRHYNAGGEALQKALLKAPLAFTRISSGYSLNRKHPVSGYSLPHQGVDYAAPAGTPIMAVGDGVITRAGWGNGYGNMIIIKHSGGLESQYAHMSGFARGMKNGARVRQGQTIGYVGATGVATGPHLDFRLKQNGKFINPTRVIVPRENPVDKKRMPAFQKMVAAARSYLNGETTLAGYSPEAWLK